MTRAKGRAQGSAKAADSVRQAYTFPRVNEYGNYTAGERLPKGVTNIAMNGSIRTVRKLGIPHVEIVSVEWVYGNTYKPRVVGYAFPADREAELQAALEQAERKRKACEPKPLPEDRLVEIIREASRAAHRERDAAQEAYLTGRHTLATNSRERKNDWYALKDRGIAHAHGRGLLRYAGETPQGMALYEWGDGGMSCFHSTLHPVGVERVKVEGHPETLEVPAKDKLKGLSLKRIEATLRKLPPVDAAKYQRSAAPRKPRPATVCYRCGQEGHIQRNCPQPSDKYDLDDIIDDRIGGL